MKIKGIQYKGEQNDYYHGNAYSLKCMLVLLAVLVFSWLLDVLNIFIVDMRIMNIATLATAGLCGIALLYALLIGIDTKSSRYVIMSLLVSVATAICTELAYHTTMFMIFPLVCSAQYFDKKVSIFTAVATCAGIAFSVMVGYHIGLCDSNMLLLTYTTSALHLQELLSNTFTINTDRSLMFLFFVFPRWLIVLAMMPLLNHVSKDIQIRSEREAVARRTAEIDGLTGLYNRNKYLQAISTLYPACDQVAVLFFDINNLKTVNDTRGHEYGDILIRGLSESLQEWESDHCKCYRIGGDEFVMIFDGSEVQNAPTVRDRLSDSLQGLILDGDITLSVAVGMAQGKGRNIESIVNAADGQMYKSKIAMKA